MKIKIYWGDRTFFEESIKNEIEENSLTLSEYLRILEEKKIEIKSNSDSESIDLLEKNIKNTLPNLVCYSDDFLSLSDSGLNNFLSVSYNSKIDNNIIQNPPNLIKEKLEHSKLISKEKFCIYNKITLDIIEIFAKDFNKKIIGQESARNELIKALFKKSKKNKPLIIMLYGPSGVGKTETAKFIAKLFKQKLFRKQFSMFQTTTYGEYLFGDSHNKNSLAKDLLDRESNIILFDEFDKTSNFFHSAFYQLFDEGIYVDKNYIVNLKDSIILCTSNYRNLNELKNALGAPLFYRFDHLIEFKELNDEAKLKIIEIYLNKSFNELIEDDKKVVRLNEHKQKLDKVVKKLNNVRQIKNLIENLFLDDLVKKEIKNY